MSEPSPTEDLMREHGLLDRILLIYEFYLGQIHQLKPIDLALLTESTQIIRSFIEEYHEPMEEKYIFAPLLEKKIEVELITELIVQHKVSKLITGKIFTYVAQSNIPKIDYYIRMFLHMYRAHESREDTVIFNKFREMTPPARMAELGDEFERSETEKFGPDGYERILQRVNQIETNLGIHNLKSYTPDI